MTFFNRANILFGQHGVHPSESWFLVSDIGPLTPSPLTSPGTDLEETYEMRTFDANFFSYPSLNRQPSVFHHCHRETTGSQSGVWYLPLPYIPLTYGYLPKMPSRILAACGYLWLTCLGHYLVICFKPFVPTIVKSSISNTSADFPLLWYHHCTWWAT